MTSIKQEYKKQYTSIVELVASCSKDKRLKVGSLLLKDGRIISTGYNGHLPGTPHTPIIQNSHDISTIHAEQNCLLHAAKLGISTKDCVMFVSHYPCSICTKEMIMAGINKVYYVHDYRNDDNVFRSYIQIEKIDEEKEK